MIFRSAIAAALIVLAPSATAAQYAPDRFDEHATISYTRGAQEELSVSSVGRSLASPRTALTLAAFAALLPVDESISRAMRDSSLQESDFLQAGKDVFNTVGAPGVLLVSVGAWAGGAVAGSDGLRDAGWHATEAIAISGVVTTIIKEMAGRVRPNASPDDAFDFSFAAGLTDRGGRSLPSGHATAAFAFAATLSEELKVRHPDIARYANPAAYGVATLVALTRVYHQKHWPSDVLLGSAIGVFTARIITRHAHRKKPD